MIKVAARSEVSAISTLLTVLTLALILVACRFARWVPKVGQ